jgi:hypothetical protein
LRSACAVIAGYLVFAVCSFALFRLSGHDPYADANLSFKCVTIVCGMAFALAGGYVTARLAPRNPRGHGVALAALLAAFAAFSIFMMPAKGHAWTQIAAIFLMAPAAFAGSTLVARSQARAAWIDP